MEQLETRLLQVNDVVYGKSNYGLTEKIVINKVSPLQASSGFKKFKRVIAEDGCIRRIAQESWSVTRYYIESPELINEWFKKEAVERLNLLNWNALSLNQIKAILKIIDAKYLKF